MKKSFISGRYTIHVDRVGRFQIVKELGRGAMGVVYQAVDPTIGRSVAIKTILLREVDDREQRDRLRERLFREARSAGVLSHPHIVTIYDMDEEDGLAYIAMQFVNGPTVESVLDGLQPLAPEQIFRILRHTAAALDFAHARGIVHRDVKPANIMIDEDGTVKIADFGIAKASASGNLTASGTILGTPNYMSPEQVQGTSIDGRSDQFSLGVVAYEILTGELPFAGENLGTVIYRIVAEAPAEPAQINPALGDAIGQVLEKALQKNPKRRFLSCTEFINSLIGACEATPGWHGLARSEAAAGSLCSTAKPARSRAAASLTGAPAEPRSPAKQPPLRQPTGLVLPALAAFTVVLGVLGLVAWQARVPNRPEPKPASITPATPPDYFETPPPAETTEASVPQSSAPSQTEPAVEPEPEPARESASPPARSRAASRPQPTATRPERALLSKRSPFAVPTWPAFIATAVPVAPSPSPLLDISVATNPPGATAMLDGRAESSCQTPCLLLSPPGIHTLALTLRDYQPERRQLRIADEPEDVPLISLRPVGGTLMISTIPAGANIFLNDTMLATLTPAQIPLQPGRYNVAVERDGTRKSQQVVVKNGAMNYLRIPLPD